MTSSRFTRPWFTHSVAIAALAGASLAVAAVDGSAAPVAADPSPAQVKACVWKTVAAPTPGVAAASLRGVDAISPKNIWAVGSQNAQGATLIEHWNGKQWKVVKSPNRSSFTQLEDVVAVSAKNVWAVGFYVPTGKGKPHTLIEHWNGTKWSLVKSPNPLKGVNVLFGVDAASARGVYAVGANNLGASAASKQVGLRLVRGQWKAIKPIGGESATADVAALPKGKALAVGHTGAVGSSDALVEELKGNAWQTVAATTSATGVHLEAISAEKGRQWAVGQRSGTAALQTLAMRKGAGGWAQTPSPNSSDTRINLLRGVVGVSKNEAWSVGYHEDASFTRRTLIEHYAGGEWSIVNSPNTGGMHNELLDVTATQGDLWAVGYSTTSLGSKVLVQARRC